MTFFKRYELSTYFLLLCIAFTLLFRTAGVGVLNRNQEIRERNTTLYAQEIAKSLANQIEPAFAAAYSLGALVEQGSTLQSLDALARKITERWPIVSWVVLAPGGKVTNIFPTGIAGASIGLNLLSDPTRGPDARRAIELHSVTLSGPYRLMEGPVGFTVRLPVYIQHEGKEDVFWGFAVSVITLDTFLERSSLRDIEKVGYRWSLSKKEQKAPTSIREVEPSAVQENTEYIYSHTVFASSLDGLPIDPISVEVPGPYSSWVFSLSSPGMQDDGIEHTFLILASILLAVFFSFFITSYISRSRSSRALAYQNELLLREIHHRVKNNLAIVESMLSLMASEAGDHHFADKFDDLSRRIHSITLIHEKLYSGKDLDRIDGPAYIHDLCTFIASGISSSIALPEITVAPLSLTSKAALPIGLILTELFTNAVKYGSGGKIHISLLHLGQNLELSVENEGPPPPSNYKDQSGLGLRLVDSLTTQLHGTWHAESGPPVRFVIKFPANQAIPPSSTF